MEVKKGQRVWITRYALSSGIEENVASHDTSDYISVQGVWSLLKLGRDVHLSERAAIKAANAMRTKKIASLRAQIKKLEAMSFRSKENPVK